MKFLSNLLQKLKPQSDWDSFQEEKAINLAKKIRLLAKTQVESNQFVKKLLSSNNSKEVSTLIREDALNDFIILGADSTLFRKLLNEYPNLYFEYNKLLKNLLDKDNLAIVIREYGIIPVLINLTLFVKKDILSKEKYLEVIKHIYSSSTLKSFIALAELIKNSINMEGMEEAIQIALDQGIIDISDLAEDEDDINLLKNFVRKSIKLPNDRYSRDRIHSLFDELKYFIGVINQVLSSILKGELKEAIEPNK